MGAGSRAQDRLLIERNRGPVQIEPLDAGQRRAEADTKRIVASYLRDVHRVRVSVLFEKRKIAPHQMIPIKAPPRG